MAIIVETVYFEKPGVQNTDVVLQIARQRAEQLNIRTVLVASTSGSTAVKAVQIFENMKVIVVTSSTGLRKPDVQDFRDENRVIVQQKGAIILTATHVLGGLTRAMHQSNIKEAPFTYTIGDIVANTLRIFGQGMKVVCEITAMAADAGLVHTDETVIAITGTSTLGGGADTAVVIQPSNSHNVFDMRIREVLCKPHF